MAKAIINIFITVLLLLPFSLTTTAQIGYQVALLNQKTGEPRANETVSVTISITDNAGTMVCSETKSATTNGAGILSLEVGNATTFDNTQWDKLPLWVSATVDGITIGRTQILSVPVAEYAKRIDSLDKRLIIGRSWSFTDNDTQCEGTLHFTSTTANINAHWLDSEGGFSKSSPYIISGYTIITSFGIFAYDKANSRIIGIADDIEIIAH